MCSLTPNLRFDTRDNVSMRNVHYFNSGINSSTKKKVCCKRKTPLCVDHHRPSKTHHDGRFSHSGSSRPPKPFSLPLSLSLSRKQTLSLPLRQTHTNKLQHKSNGRGKSDKKRGKRPNPGCRRLNGKKEGRSAEGKPGKPPLPHQRLQFSAGGKVSR